MALGGERREAAATGKTGKNSPIARNDCNLGRSLSIIRRQCKAGRRAMQEGMERRKLPLLTNSPVREVSPGDFALSEGSESSLGCGM